MTETYNDDDIVILDGYRTPIGKLGGCLKSLAAHQLGGIVIRKLLDECQLKSEHISEVILGQALTGGQGQNPARQASVAGGLDYNVPACGISFLCGSGLKAVVNGYQAIRSGDAEVIIAGGQESMTNAPHCIQMRDGVKFGNATLTDSMVYDGLTDIFNKYHMGITAENVAKQWNITREVQDHFSVNSQQKAASAQTSGHFESEIVPVNITTRKEKTTVLMDEHPTPDTSYEVLSKLRPAFIKDGTGTVTAGNASGINDGAAAVVICKMSVVKNLSLKNPFCRIVSWGRAGIDPSIMGVAPVYAIRKAMSKIEWSIEDVDIFELNEAFAAQSLAVVRELQIPIEKVNVSGGAIALGHPIGASGCRILVTLIHAMKRLNKRRGVAALCIGGGMGIAICVERI